MLQALKKKIKLFINLSFFTMFENFYFGCVLCFAHKVLYSKVQFSKIGINVMYIHKAHNKNRNI